MHMSFWEKEVSRDREQVLLFQELTVVLTAKVKPEGEFGVTGLLCIMMTANRKQVCSFFSIPIEFYTSENILSV